MARADAARAVVLSFKYRQTRDGKGVLMVFISFLFLWCGEDTSGQGQM